MTTEYGRFDEMGYNTATLLEQPRYDVASLSASLQPAGREISDSFETPVVRREPRTPSWSYESNPLYAEMPPSVRAGMAHEATPIAVEAERAYLATSAERLAQRVTRQAVEMPPVFPAYTPAETPYTGQQEQFEPQAPRRPFSVISHNLFIDDIQTPLQPESESFSHIVDFPVTNQPYAAPKALWEAPRRQADDNIGLEREFQRGPLPDSLTPRLSPQESPVTPALATTTEQSVAEVSVVHPEATTALLSRLENQVSTPAYGLPNGETTQVVDMAELHGFTPPADASAGDQLVDRITASAPTAPLVEAEREQPRRLVNYGKRLLEAAGLRMRTRQDSMAEIFDQETGEIVIDGIDMREKDVRMNTVRRLIGKLTLRGVKVPPLSEA